MRNRLFASLLSLCMVISLFSGLTITASAVDAATPLSTNGGELSAGTYYLPGDIVLTQALAINSSAEVTLYLNGYTLTGPTGDSVIYINGGTLNLYGNYTTATGNLEDGGQITGGTSTDWNKGGGVTLNGGAFNMYGGTIVNNTRGSDGVGGVNVTGGAFNMHGGKISGNAGGLNVTGSASSATIHSGATITGNTVTSELSGGGVHVLAGGTVTLNGGTISGNRAAVDGGGVFVGSGGTFIMSSGTISGNTAGNEGGGVCVNTGDSGNSDALMKNDGSFTMTGGSITNNTATANGGGVLVRCGMTVSGTLSITGNQVGEADNNIHLANGQTITVPNSLTDGAALGITTATAPAESAPVTVADGSSAVVGSSFFSSDNSDYDIDVSDSAIILKLKESSDGMPTEGLTRAELAKLIYDKFLPAGTGVPSTAFTDISECDEAQQTAINALAAAGIISGTGDATFSPNGTVTPGAVAMVIRRTSGESGDATPSAAVDALGTLGILSAEEVTNAKDDTYVVTADTVTVWLSRFMTRAELAVLVADGFELEAQDVSVSFTDLAGCSTAQVDAINRLAQNGIIQGTQNSVFSPRGIADRGTVAALLWKAAGGDTTAAEQTLFDDAGNYASALNYLVAEGVLTADDAVNERAFAPGIVVDAITVGTWLERISNDDTPSVDGITRAELAVLIAEKFELQPTEEEITFNDLDDCTEDQKAAILLLAQNGIVSGNQQGGFDPDGTINGTLAATVIYRAHTGNNTAAPSEAVAALIEEGILSEGEATNDVVTEETVSIWLSRITTGGDAPTITATAPTITTQPQALNVKEGYTSGNTMTVVATVAEKHTISYQWYSNTNNSVEGGVSINGATSSSYTVPTGKAANTAEYYYCVITATHDDDNTKTASVTSDIAAFSVSAQDAIDISSAVITMGTQKTYNGTVQQVVIESVTVDGAVLTKDVDYTIIAGGSATNVGNVTLTITGKGNYSGTASTQWSLQKEKITVTALNQTYEINLNYNYIVQPKFYLPTTPVEGTDYTISGLVGSDTLGGSITLGLLRDGEVATGQVYDGDTVTISGATVPNTGNYDENISYVFGKVSIKLVGGGIVAPIAPTPETETIPADGNANVEVEVTVKNNEVTVSEIPASDINKVEDEPISLDFSNLDESVFEVTLPTDTVEDIADSRADGLKITLSTGTVSFDATAVDTISDVATGKNIVLNVEAVETVDLTSGQKDSVEKLGGSLIIKVTLTSGGKTISDFNGGNASITIPYERKDNGKTPTVYFLDDSGRLTRMQTNYDPTTKTVTFVTPHFSEYVVAEVESLPFIDVVNDTYYADAVLWAVSNGITNGTSTTTFSPDASCTRAQMVTFLWRAAGSPEPTTNTCPFTDVDMDSYYGKAVLWAVEKDITNGTSNAAFSPDADCTRAQMATFLCRMAGGKSVGSTNAFTDIEPDMYYTEAVQWAVENGITNGTGDNKFSPNTVCTRAQMVTFLYRLFAK